MLRKGCFRIVLLENNLENPLDSKEIKPVNPKGNQPSIFIGRTDAEAEAPVLWPPDAKSCFVMLGKMEGKRRKGQDRMRCLDSITNSVNMNLSKLELVADRRACAIVHEASKCRTQLSV